MANKIVLIGMGRHEEAVAAGAITPGHLIKLDSAGKVVVHASEGQYAERLFAKEDALQGNTKDTAYASGDVVSYHVAVPGDEIFAYIKAGENVAIGDQLISAGDGTLIKIGSVSSGVTVTDVIAVAKEANDLSGSGAANTRSAVRVV